MSARFYLDSDRLTAAPEPARATILVVEDESLVRAMVAEELRDHCYDVIEAGDASEALSVLREEGPVDLLLTDVRMPGPIDGADLARIARAEFPAMKIVVSSGHMAEAAFGGTIDGFLLKPYHLSQLVSRLRTLLP